MDHGASVRANKLCKHSSKELQIQRILTFCIYLVALFPQSARTRRPVWLTRTARHSSSSTSVSSRTHNMCEELCCTHNAHCLSHADSCSFLCLLANHSEYESMPGKARKVIKARDLWKLIIAAQTETGTPYMLFKDACNASQCASAGVKMGAESALIDCRSSPPFACFVFVQSRISRIWARSSARTCAPRSSSTRRRRKSLCATSHLSLFPCS